MVTAAPLLTLDVQGAVGHVRLNRPAKRNALNDALIAELHAAFVNLPDAVNVIVLSGEGEHFSAGLDLSELTERSARVHLIVHDQDSSRSHIPPSFSWRSVPGPATRGEPSPRSKQRQTPKAPSP